jgi:periplasmic protein TonB
MGYQALLFCPDEKTARTVTQVLSELDFAVSPCTEPFAAVKKLMGERFDAVVVDCDNEQNATLLFKSARNAPNNHSSLAVAVVEGQAGVAKAFRIGANLVLTKPVNVEQAKGTLRVARGLLRKSEAAKPAAGAATTAAKPTAPVSAPPKLVPPRTIPGVSNAGVSNAGVSNAGAAAPIVPSAAAASIPTPKAEPRPAVVASVSTEINPAAADLFEATHEKIASPPIVEGKIVGPGKAVTPSSTVGPWPTSGGFGKGAASAPAPALEPKPVFETENKPPVVISEPESPVEKTAIGSNDSSVEAIAATAAAPALTFGGTVDAGAESAGGGSKKMLLAVAALVLLAAGGYAVWMQWVRSSGAATPFTQVTAQPKTAPTAVPSAAPKPAPIVPSSAASSSAPSSTTGPQQTGTKAVASSVDSSKPPVSAVAENKAPATSGTERPIVVKSRPAQPGAGTSASSEVAAPSIDGIASAGNTGSLPNLMGSGKAPAPVLQNLHVSQGVSRGLLMKEVPPVYPASAMRMHVEGAVDLLATISKNGDISAVKVLNGDAQLSHAAVDAVKQWKYKPYLLNGEPVEIQTQVTVKFKLPR